MAIVTGDRYLELLVKFVENQAEQLIEGTLVLKLNPVGLHYVQSRLEALAELEGLLAGAPIDYLRAYVSDLGDHRALEQLRRILRLLTSLKVVSVLPPSVRDPTPLSLLPFGRLRMLELRGCDLSTSSARGLLELRHTLEKLICHNSTDALRHVFASRIVDIKDSPQWNHMSFLSCACNGLVLMDESLQLLPTVETLDLSRNKFTKVDNLRKCNKLKHLDLGFNHLRTVASLSEVICQIVKLVLRNNALTSLRGIENLQSLEGLDLSYNIISNFSELEILSGLLSLQSLWLEGNPLCSARWYRAQVYSFFPRPDELELDDKKICTKEFWKRQIIIASRQKRPASFGFYSPARNDVDLVGCIDTKRKKLYRLANIESEQSAHVCSDQESMSCENEVQSKEGNVPSDEEADIVDLMNRIEFMKKERSILWLQEFKEWMDQASENSFGRSRYREAILFPDKENNRKNKTSDEHIGESSGHPPKALQSSCEERSTDILDSGNSFAEVSSGFSAQRYFDRIGEAASKFFRGDPSGVSVPSIKRQDPNQEDLKPYYAGGAQSMKSGNPNLDSNAVPGGGGAREKKSVMPLAAINDIMESYPSSACLSSPPHYQEDILHRRQNLEEEFLHLSAESYSVASSDSDTTCSDNESSEFGEFIPRVDQSVIDRNVDAYSTYHKNMHDVSELIEENGLYTLDSRAEQTHGVIVLRESSSSPLLSEDSFSASAHDNEIVHHVKQDADWLERRKCKRKPKRRVISLTEENNMNDESEPSLKVNDSSDVLTNDRVEEQGNQGSHDTELHRFIDKKHSWKNTITTSHSDDSGTEGLIMNYFNSNVADSGVQEICRQYMLCNCILEEKSECKESEVAVLRSSEHKLYMLLINGGFDGSGTSIRLLGHYRVEEIKEALVGLGLLIIRVFIERDETYRFVTRSADKSRQLLCMLDLFDTTKDVNCLRSLELIQVDMFQRHICGGSNMSIFQYSMVLFCVSNLEEDLWISRSLFVLERHLLVCIEDLLQFGSFSENECSSYLLLDSCCFIVDVQEMVIETRERLCLTLVLKRATPKFCLAAIDDKVEDTSHTKKPASCPVSWKLQWFSEESLYNFMALLKALGASSRASPLGIS